MSKQEYPQQQESDNGQVQPQQKAGIMNEFGARLVTGQHSHKHPLSPIDLNL